MHVIIWNDTLIVKRPVFIWGDLVCNLDHHLDDGRLAKSIFIHLYSEPCEDHDVADEGHDIINRVLFSFGEEKKGFWSRSTF